MDDRKMGKVPTGAGEKPPPLLTVRQFKDSPEFANFEEGMRKLLTVSKSDLDAMVRNAKDSSPRMDNPNAAGRKRKTST